MKLSLRQFSSPGTSPVDLEIESGDRIALVGPTRCGKSQFLLALAGLVDADYEQFHFGEEDLLHEERLFEKIRIGFCFQEDALLYDLSARENVLLASKNADVAIEILSRLGLSGSMDFFPAELSGGMRRRVALARALACEPELLLLDSLTAGLDPSTSASVMELAIELSAEFSSTMIIASQDVDVILPHVSRVLGFVDGQLIFDDVPKKLGASPELSSYAPISVELA